MTHGQKFRGHPRNRGGATDRTGLENLTQGDLGGNTLDAGHLLGDGLGVFEHQGLGKINALAAGVVVAWNNKKHICAQVAQLTLSQVLGALANPHQGYHRSIADHNAEHGEQAAQLVGAQGGEGHPHRFAHWEFGCHGCRNQLCSA